MKLRDLHPGDHIVARGPIRKRVTRPDGTICFEFEEGGIFSGHGDDNVLGALRNVFKPPEPTPPIGNAALGLTPIDWSSM